MCSRCNNADYHSNGYIIYYTCKERNNDVSVIIDTYFNETDVLIDCAKEQTQDINMVES